MSNPTFIFLIIDLVLIGTFVIAAFVFLFRTADQGYTVDGWVNGILAGAMMGLAVLIFKNLTKPMIALGWVVFTLPGLLGLILVIWGGIFDMLLESNILTGMKKIAGGLFCLAAAVSVSIFWLHLPWLSYFWNPFVILPLTTILIGLSLGFLSNLFATGNYQGGDAIDPSAEWRLVGSTHKFRSATVREVYEHAHGSGSWLRDKEKKVNLWRLLFGLVSAFGLYVLLLTTGFKDAIPGLQNTYNIMHSYSVLAHIGLIILLALVSFVTGLVFAGKS